MEYKTNMLAVEASESSPETGEQLALLERVASSSQLKRSARLRELLLFIGRQSIKGSFSDIHEQEIGVEVFGRSLTYDTSQDNIVRVNVTELRKRIELYFSSEGAKETLVFEIPRGSYKAVFRRRTIETQPPAPLFEEQQSAVSPALPNPDGVESTRQEGAAKTWLALSVLVVITLAVVCLVLLQKNRIMSRELHGWEGKPALAAFWPAFLREHQATDIVLADTSIALLEDITKHPVSLTEYLNRSYISGIQSDEFSADRKADMDLIVSRHNGSIGDFRAAQQILAMDKASSSVHMEFARDYTADSIKRNNVVLIGSWKSNPWVRLFEDHLNFAIEYDPNLRQTFVANRKPQPGEQNSYAAPVDPYASTGYSVIAYLPNPSHTGNVIILAGTTSEGTHAAGEFLTSEESMEKLQSKLHMQDAQSFPYFEVFLKTTHLSGTPFSAEIVAYRSYPKLR